MGARHYWYRKPICHYKGKEKGNTRGDHNDRGAALILRAQCGLNSLGSLHGGVFTENLIRTGRAMIFGKKRRSSRTRNYWLGTKRAGWSWVFMADVRALIPGEGQKGNLSVEKMRKRKQIKLPCEVQEGLLIEDRLRRRAERGQQRKHGSDGTWLGGS